MALAGGDSVRIARMSSPIKWNKETLLQSPIFAPLHPVISRFESFASREELNALLEEYAITVASGRGLRFVAQDKGRLAFEQQYEPRCYLTGEVQTRTDNWHDLLNALVWLTYPKAKAAINVRHYQALTQVQQLREGRGTVRDTNTLLDESGVIVACSDDELAALLRSFSWKELFWEKREQLRCRMGFYLFGHGLYEKALQPYVGMTGHGLLLKVEPVFFNWTFEEQRAHLDNLVAHYLANPAHCLSTRELCPVPLLGVPGWSADNECASYYDNTAYFRPGRSR